MKVLSGALRVVPALLELEADSNDANRSDAAATQRVQYPGWFAQILQVLSEALPTVTAGLTLAAAAAPSTKAVAVDGSSSPPPAAAAVEAAASSIIFVTIASYYRNDTQSAVESGIFELVSSVCADASSDVVHYLEPLLVSLSRSPRGREALVQTSEKEVDDIETSHHAGIEVGGISAGSSPADVGASPLTDALSGGGGGAEVRARRSSSGAAARSPVHASSGGGAPAAGRIVPVLDLLIESIREFHNSRLDTVCPVLIALLKDSRFGGWLVHTYRQELSDEHLSELAKRTNEATTSFNKHVAALRECIAVVKAESGDL